MRRNPAGGVLSYVHYVMTRPLVSVSRFGLCKNPYQVCYSGGSRYRSCGCAICVVLKSQRTPTDASIGCWTVVLLHAAAINASNARTQVLLKRRKKATTRGAENQELGKRHGHVERHIASMLSPCLPQKRTPNKCSDVTNDL